MIDHISVSVSDPVASKAFYEAALAPLGYRVVMEFAPFVGLGAPAPGAPEDDSVRADLWLAPAEKPTPCHVAVTASSTAQVDAFHEAALAAGGTDNGGPGERPHYHPGYYGAFVLDPDGNNLEAVFHGTGD
ncbi:VOC family protein [Actinomyces viscosus]|uniref:Predicted lactoylglutathione lyase n=1 Tax=Actinomyces viscosus TaxID=1656 RepID=A0A448PLV3_ACTVI|nr:VOC family protein [Actinomyces viscosus]TFH51891.1 VOC family protein [Actinomyces viscosus]VEI16664.1 Predicted lactoylglutathione lyase [Actinomyces viscosus]